MHRIHRHDERKLLLALLLLASSWGPTSLSVFAQQEGDPGPQAACSDAGGSSEECGWDEVAAVGVQEEQHATSVAPAAALPSSSRVTVEQLEAQLRNVTEQLASLTAQVTQLQAQSASHAKQLATLQHSGASAVRLSFTAPHDPDGLDPRAARLPPGTAGGVLSPSSGSSGSASGWLDHFLMLALLRPPALANGSSTPAGGEQAAPEDTGAPASAMAFTTVQPLQTDPAQGTIEKPPRYIAGGCADGTLAIFSTRGVCIGVFETGSASPVTAIASYAMRRNESIVLTGHLDGELRTHSLSHWPNATGTRGGIRVMRLKNVLLGGTTKPGLLPEEAHPIAQILPIRSGTRMVTKRSVAVWDTRGWLRLLRDNGTVRGAAHSNRSLLANHQNGVQLVGLGPSHALVHRQHQPNAYRTVTCQHLNGTRLVAAAFDPVRMHRAYAVNDAGQLLLLTVPYDNKLNTCKVSRAITLPLHLMPSLQYCLLNQQRQAQAAAAATDAVAAAAAAMDAGAASSVLAQHLVVGSDADGADQTSTVRRNPEDVPVGAAGAAGGNGSGPAQPPCLLPGMVSMVAMRGYVVMLHPEAGLLFNVSGLRMMLAPPMVAEPWMTFAGMLGLPYSLPVNPSPPNSASQALSPLAPMLSVSTLAKGMLLVSLSPPLPFSPPPDASPRGLELAMLKAPAAVVAVLESELPVPTALQQDAMTQDSGKSLWAQPLFIGLMMLVGFWQFRKARNQLGSNGTANFSARRSALDDLSGLDNLASLAGFGNSADRDGALRTARTRAGGNPFRPAVASGGGPVDMSAAHVATYQAAYDPLQRHRGWHGEGLDEGLNDDEDVDEEDLDVAGLTRRGSASQGVGLRGRAARGAPYGGTGGNGLYGSGPFSRPPAHLGGVAAAAARPGMAFGGYPGPRSMQRGLRMGTAPVLHSRPLNSDDNGHGAADDDGSGEEIFADS